MPGYSLLPTLPNPTSTLTFRLTNDEMKERNEWMRGALNRGMMPDEIAREVGLSVARTKQILFSPKEKKQPKRVRKVFNTPLEAAVDEFWREQAHKECADLTHPKGMCADCYGRWMLIESAYDSNGWPYSWAWTGQGPYIHTNMKIPDGVEIPEYAYSD